MQVVISFGHWLLIKHMDYKYPARGCSFILLIIYFALQKFFFLVGVHSIHFIFAFTASMFLVLYTNTSLPRLTVRRLYPGCFSKSFILSDLIIRSLIHFQVFCKDSTPLFFMKISNFLSNIYWKISLSLLCPFQKELFV